MDLLADAAELELFLNQDWPWAGFAIGDLEPEWMRLCEWLRCGDTVVLLFAGLSPRILCHLGDGSGLATILSKIRDERVWANIRPEFEDIFRRFYRPEQCVRMCRMYLEKPVTATGRAERLSSSDLPEVEELLASGERVLFWPACLASGHYYGVRENGLLVAMAGTHLASSRFNIAALGSVFTRSEHRGKGLATTCCSHALASVARAGISRVVLNVEERNAGARRIYERFGFRAVCTYLDGECSRIV